MPERCHVFGCGPEKCMYGVQAASDKRSAGPPQSAEEFLALPPHEQRARRGFFVTRAENYARDGCPNASADVEALAAASHPLAKSSVIIDART